MRPKVITSKICPNCNKEYILSKPSSKQKYCSAKCAFKGRVRPKNPLKKEQITCVVCGKSFEAWAYRQSKCCSKKCASSLSFGVPKPTRRRPDSFITKNCTICGKPYTIHKIFIKKRISNYCSSDCRAKFFSETRRGINNPNFVHGNPQYDYGDDWLKQSRKAKKRDDHTCQICGYKSGGNRYLDVHHIVPFVKFGIERYKEANHLTNLISLCRPCHAKVEKETRAIWGNVPLSPVDLSE